MKTPRTEVVQPTLDFLSRLPAAQLSLSLLTLAQHSWGARVSRSFQNADRRDGFSSPLGCPLAQSCPSTDIQRGLAPSFARGDNLAGPSAYLLPNVTPHLTHQGLEAGKAPGPAALGLLGSECHCHGRALPCEGRGPPWRQPQASIPLGAATERQAFA